MASTNMKGESKKTILILTAPYGDGHMRAAEAIAEAIADGHPGCEARLVDYFRSFVPDVVTALSRKAYLDSIRLTPYMYGLFYHSIGKVKPDSRLRRMMDSPGRRGLAQFLKGNPVDAVISLYPIPSGAASHLRERGALAAPLITVVTDYTCHSEWIHKGTDAYVVGSECVAEMMVERGVMQEKIHALGIPVRAAFSLGAEGDLGARGSRRVLVMAGAYGSLGGIRDVADASGRRSEEIEVTFVCGRAEGLAEKVRSHTAGWTRPPRVLGFVDDIAGEMLAADLIVSKAGGITVSEALALGRPLLIYKPIPGQEERNCEFLESAGAGLAVRSPGQLKAVLGELLDGPGSLRQMAEAARRTGKPRAARDIAELALEVAGECLTGL